MSVLSWDKPEKIMTREEWEDISADGAPPGVYTPNMSAEDAARWKAKLIGARGDHPRVEIRKTTDGGVQILIIVCADEVATSMNGTARMSLLDTVLMEQAIMEAAHEIESRGNKEAQA